MFFKRTAPKTVAPVETFYYSIVTYKAKDGEIKKGMTTYHGPFYPVIRKEEGWAIEKIFNSSTKPLDYLQNAHDIPNKAITQLGQSWISTDLMLHCSRPDAAYRDGLDRAETQKAIDNPGYKPNRSFEESSRLC